MEKKTEQRINLIIHDFKKQWMAYILYTTGAVVVVVAGFGKKGFLYKKGNIQFF
jgi:hypothetical protein